MSLAFAANSGGVDEAEAASIVLNNFVDCIARGAGNGRNNGGVGSREAIQQRRLPDVGMADDGDFGFVDGRIVGGRWPLVVGRWRFIPVFFEWLRPRQGVKHVLERLVDSAAVLGGGRGRPI